MKTAAQIPAPAARARDAEGEAFAVFAIQSNRTVTISSFDPARLEMHLWINPPCNMTDRANMTLTELIEQAEQYDLVDSWGRIGDTIVLRLATMTVDLEAEKAKPFVRGLLRGYEVAQALNGES